MSKYLDKEGLTEYNKELLKKFTDRYDRHLTITKGEDNLGYSGDEDLYYVLKSSDPPKYLEEIELGVLDSTATPDIQQGRRSYFYQLTNATYDPNGTVGGVAYPHLEYATVIDGVLKTILIEWNSGNKPGITRK